MNSVKEYYKECLLQSIDENGIDNIDAIIDDLLISIEQESMAFGYDCIPAPEGAETTKLKKEIERLKSEKDSEYNLFLQYFADKYNTDTTNINVEVHCGKIERINIRN